MEIKNTIDIGLGEDHKQSWNADGKSGGLIAVWDTNKFTLQSKKKGDGYLAITGDFNEVRSPCERIGSNFCQKGTDLFNEFISTSGLVEPSLYGMRYTRMNSIGSKLSKLDRFLVSSHFVDLWPNSHALALAREFSDHSPIILYNSTTVGPVPFKFYNSWIELNDLKPIVQASWTTTRPRSIQTENTRATILRDQLVTIDTKAESGPLKTTEIDNRANTVKELHDFEHRKIKDIRQKTKSRWTLEGDENSSFF
ncbi:cytochrome P450, partial [Tanacetum coccineum]